jgi:outer membrane protein insertion porin family
MARFLSAIPGCLLILFHSACLWAAEPPSREWPGSYEGLPIVSIEVEPGGRIDSREIEEICSLRPGDPFSYPAVRNCLDQFFPSETYEDVRVETVREEEGVRLVFHFIEKLRISEIEVTGGPTVPDKQLLRLAGLKSGEEFRPDRLGTIEGKLRTWYYERGYFETEVDIRGEETSGRRVKVVLHVEEGPRAQVSTLVFAGEKVFSDDRLYKMVKTRPGRPYDREIFSGDVRTLEEFYLDQGYINAAILPPREVYRPGTAEVDVTLVIDAGPRVEVRLEGVDAFRKDRVERNLTLREEKNFDDLVLENSARRIQEFYQDAGYYFAEVNYRRETPEPGRVLIVFTVREGKKIEVDELTIAGNRFFSDRKIEKAIETEEGEIYLDERAEKDAETIRLLYREEGFGEAQVAHTRNYDAQEGKLSVAFEVSEGPRVFIGRIFLKGVDAVSEKAILFAMESRVGEPYVEPRARDDRYTIQSLYAQKGYIYATVDFKKELSFDGRYALVTYEVQEDRPVRIGELHLEGNLFTKSHVILREVTLEKGDPFNYEEVLINQRRLRQMGIFADVRLEPFRPEVKEYVKDLNLRVEEGRPGYVELAVGYGDVEKFRGALEIGYRNLFGTGRQISIRGEGSDIEQQYVLTYKEPWIFGFHMDGSASLVDLIEDKVSFHRETLGLTAGVEKSFGEKVKASVFYQYEDVAVSDVAEGAILTEEDTGEGKVKVATINPSLVMDFRDDPFNPSSGSFYAVTFRDAAQILGGKPQFVKLTVQGDWFYFLFPRIILAAGMRGGVAERFGDSPTVPIFERFFVGGRSSVRGYEEEKLGVPGETILARNGEWTPTGGNTMAVLNAEIRLALPRGFGLVFFVDGGNVWESPGDLRASELRSTAGAGLRYNTPVGPLRLDYGCKTDPEEALDESGTLVREDRCVLHFTLGHAF